MSMRTCQKRPAIWQKRPIIRTKETYRYTGIPELVQPSLSLAPEEPVCHVCVCVWWWWWGGGIGGKDGLQRAESKRIEVSNWVVLM